MKNNPEKRKCPKCGGYSSILAMNFAKQGEMCSCKSTEFSLGECGIYSSNPEDIILTFEGLPPGLGETFAKMAWKVKHKLGIKRGQMRKKSE